MTETTKKRLTTFSQVNFRKKHEILDQLNKSIKSYIKMFDAAGQLGPPAQVGLSVYSHHSERDARRSSTE